MRWDRQRVGAETERSLPGYRDPAVVRTFDAPEALDTRFYEVRARSALNRVPERSRMPFRWTVNPYRGCSHACVYCLDPDTPILMGDGRAKPISELRVGDEIYGTERSARYRRYALTHVLARWTTRKPAYRVTLEDRSEIVASGDHRFLTPRGWKHVTGAEHGRWRRPHLTPNDKLMGIGALPQGPRATTDYRTGYLCGLIRGDGHIGSYAYPRAGGSSGEVHRFRLALTDLEPLMRARDYLERADVATQEFAFSVGSARRRPANAIRASSRQRVDRVRELTRWPRSPSVDWCKGFLAGIFDAEGSHSGCVRIANTDPTILDWTTWSLSRLGFDWVIDRTGNANGLASARIRGGLPAVLRFFLTVDPATTRKRVIAGAAIKSDAPLRIKSIDPLGTRTLYDITTRSGDFIANGVVSHNCFARPTHTYLDMGAGRDFEREIVVKVNVPEVLRAELSRPRWAREHVALGTNTDPYQWVEGRYRLMPAIWRALGDSRTPCSVLTKSPLVLRDLPVLRDVRQRADLTANLSVPTLDERAWRRTEPRTPHPRARLEAVAELNRAGIPTGVLIAPLMPGINDAPAQVERILELAAEAGAVNVGGLALHLRGEVRGIFFDWLRSERPDLVPRYEELYRRGAYAPSSERRRLARLARPDGSEPRRFTVEPETASPPLRPARSSQPSLF